MHFVGTVASAKEANYPPIFRRTGVVCDRSSGRLSRADQSFRAISPRRSRSNLRFALMSLSRCCVLPRPFHTSPSLSANRYAIERRSSSFGKWIEHSTGNDYGTREPKLFY
jgi:hypothetical protein